MLQRYLYKKWTYISCYSIMTLSLSIDSKRVIVIIFLTVGLVCIQQFRPPKWSPAMAFKYILLKTLSDSRTTMWTKDTKYHHCHMLYKAWKVASTHLDLISKMYTQVYIHLHLCAFTHILLCGHLFASHFQFNRCSHWRIRFAILFWQRGSPASPFMVWHLSHWINQRSAQMQLFARCNIIDTNACMFTSSFVLTMSTI